jgi:glutathione synthase/RimK-type ligase-like ATP-grasp enzyme
MKNVLLITFTNDNNCIEMISEALRRKGGRPVRFNTDMYPGGVTLSSHSGNGRWKNILETPEGSFDLSEFESLYYRRIRIGAQLEDLIDEKYLRASIDESRRTFFSTIAALDIFQMDSFLTVRKASQKQLQLQVAQSLGLNVPKTLITNDPAAVKKFRAMCPSGMISKMQESFAIYENGKENVVFTNLMDDETLEEMDDLKYCPMTFQECISKKLELRITIVGDKVFTAAIDSQKKSTARDDWRKEGLSFLNDWEEYELPADIREKLLVFMDRFGLNYGAIDMILDPNDNLYFLEVNSVGEFFWLERHPGFPISDAIADVLLGNAKRR